MASRITLAAGIAVSVAVLVGACSSGTTALGPVVAAGMNELPAAGTGGLEALRHAYGRLPLAFERNQGQTDARVAYLARGPGYSLFLTGTEAVFSLKRGHADVDVLRMSLEGANPAATISAHQRQAGDSQYFRGSDASGWTRDVARYGKVRYSGVYPGVDLLYYGNQQQLEYDFIVAPGSDPGRIVLDFDGSRARHLDAGGNLVLATARGSVTQRKPVAYQEINGRRLPVAAEYRLLADHRVGFRLGAYDRRHALVVDPVFEYSGSLDGSLHDWGYSIAVDRVGNAYVTGTTQSADFPVTETGPFPDKGDEVFVAKINATGDGLYYSVYLGGTMDEVGRALAVDASGNVYVTGYTRSSDFPLVGPIQATNNGFDDVFVSKINANGSALVYSTLLGGTSFDQAYGIALDASRNAYVVGTTQSANFPVQAARQPSNGGGGNRDAFVSKLNANGSALVYSTYHGGANSDYGNAIAVDAGGAAYITGETDSTNFPVVGARQASKAPFVDAYLSKFNPSGSALVYSTYQGGDSYDRGHGVAVDASGSAYLTGETDSNDFPVFKALQPAPGQVTTADAFVSKYTPAGNAFAYSTYLGGTGHDYGYAIAVDRSGNAHVAGDTRSGNFPTMAALQPSSSGDGYDAFASKLNAAGAGLVWSTYLGGNTDREYARSLALDAPGNVYLAGYEEDPANSYLTLVAAAKLSLPTETSWRGDFNGDGVSDMLLRNENTGGNQIWRSANSAQVQAVTAVGHPWAIAGIGDFDADGKSDLLWRNLSTGANSIWKAANSATQIGVGTLNPQDWAVVGVGDFNGDLRADILWHNHATAANMYWPSGNAAASVALTRVTDLGWEIVGVGNFDGDSRADILWRHSFSGRNAIWKSGSSASQQAITGIPNALWRVAGTGDFNGDGRSDILWRNQGTGGNTLWLSGNSATPLVLSNVGQGWGWFVAGTGNYDGDTRADILWRNALTGANTVWKGGNSATRQAVTAIGNPDWSIRS